MRIAAHLALGAALLVSACSAVGTPTPGVPASPGAARGPVALASVEPAEPPARPQGASCAGTDASASSLDGSMSLAGAPLRLTFQSGAPRHGGAGGWSDSVPGPTVRFAAATAPRVEAAAGTVARLAPAATLSLTDGTVAVYRLDDDDQVAPDAEPATTAELGGDASGLDVPLPVDPGRWLLGLYVRWETDCMAGDGFVDFLLDTR